ncbi:serine/threonine-protein kinase pim-2-like [Triplophysa rosa]|uniref:serine/threonine-protein kinase pim-2-like n=1 Tax=Triplophysa rosa TaxID=992332 RepID=UPI002545E1CA|nr:serine/threonine-protein kinase pim-2-like [Triplophysa rosa]
MGQKVCKCVQAESADGDRRDVYTLPEHPPVQSSADSSDHSPPPAGATDGDVGDNRDAGRRKRRFWRKFWRKGRRSAQGEREEHTTQQNTPASSTADARDRSPRPDENRDEGKKKKKRRFWKRLWRKIRSEREEESDRSPEDQIQNNLETPDLLNEDVDVIYEINSSQYEIGKELNKGGNITVYEATRVRDGLKVAVKFVRNMSPDLISIPGHPFVRQREIGLHTLANEGEHVPEIIRLLDWEERYCEYIMVLEHPSPCMDLFKFIESRRGQISENLARIIMRQAVKAVTECLKRGVFHMDFILENFLINTETLDVKLIDFANGDLLKETCYTKFLGTPNYWCPELEEVGEYHALPATVWSLGLMLYVMMFWALPGIITREQINNQEWEKDDLSTEFCRFINDCLQDDPHQRIQLKDVLLHEWFQVSGVEMIDSRFEGVSGDQMQETPELLTEAGDLLTSHHSSVSDCSDEEFCTPTLSLFDLYVNVPRRTVSSGSNSESVDSFHTAVCSVSDLLQNNEDGNVIYVLDEVLNQ